MPFLAELRQHHAAHAASLRRRRAWPDLLQVEVAQDIAFDAAREQGRVGRLAYTAQQADLQAHRILSTVLADGRVTPAEITQLRLAARHLDRSARADHHITEALA